MSNIWFNTFRFSPTNGTIDFIWTTKFGTCFWHWHWSKITSIAQIHPPWWHELPFIKYWSMRNCTRSSIKRRWTCYKEKKKKIQEQILCHKKEISQTVEVKKKKRIWWRYFFSDFFLSTHTEHLLYNSVLYANKKLISSITVEMFNGLDKNYCKYAFDYNIVVIHPST